MKETDLYEQVAQYMNLKYPKVLYHFDLSGLWTPSHQARNLYGRLNRRAWPDLFIASFKQTLSTKMDVVLGDIYPATQWSRDWHCGLFIELKKDGTVLYKRDGTMRAVPHHIEQAKVLEELRNAGYKAEFAIGFDETVKLIDEYLI